MNNEQPQAETPTAPEYRGTATYCPEDNKLRLYVGRVPRADYERLRAEGWKALHKQREAGGGDFVAVWTPGRRNTALAYSGGVILDEDMGQEERAADRAERFGGYRDKRTDEAGGHADRFDEGPAVHGYQSAQRAERAAARHDRMAGRAVDAWEKAEYWQRRTAGVISHRLHLSSPDVRMGRIKDLEAAIRKAEKEFEDRARNWRNWQKLAAITDPAKQTEFVRNYVGSTNQWADYRHPRAENLTEYYKNNDVSLYSLATHATDPLSGAELCSLFFSDHREPKIENDAWLTHYRLRLAYENQMIEAQGGRAAFVEMEVGGWIIGERRRTAGQRLQIRKINKSNATGRVVSVEVLAMCDLAYNQETRGYDRGLRPVLVNVERMSPESYQAPTDEDRANMRATLAAEKTAAPKKPECPLINPTDADAERLQSLWNATAMSEREASYKRMGYRLPVTDCAPQTVWRMTQAEYAARSKGAYARVSTANICPGTIKEPTFYNYDGRHGAPVCKVRRTHGEETYSADRVIILTDKPQKPLPAAVWEPRKMEQAALALA